MINRMYHYNNKLELFFLSWASFSWSDQFRGSLTDSALCTFKFGKRTHISMISNSVTHLRSYTSSAIADIAGNSTPISPETPCKRRCLHAKRRYRRIEWRVFRDVSQCFKSVSCCFTCFKQVWKKYS